MLSCSGDIYPYVPAAYQSQIPPGTFVSSVCPLLCGSCSPTGNRTAVGLGLRFEAYVCSVSSKPCSTTHNMNLQSTSSSHLMELWDSMTPTVSIPNLNESVNYRHATSFCTSATSCKIAGLPSKVSGDTMMRWRGFLTLSGTSNPSDYEFRVWSDDGSLLYIDGSIVVNNDGSHNWRQRYGTVKSLSEGYHSLTIVYFKSNGNDGIRAQWRPAGGVFRDISAADTRASVPGATEGVSLRYWLLTPELQ
jgi:hypothetical protein